MILEKGDMWSVFGRTDMFLITTNPIINKQGLAVMGRGMAKQIADRFPRIREDLSRLLRVYPHVNIGYIGRYDEQNVSCFMVKDHWKAEAKLPIIEESAKQLRDVARRNSAHRYDLNFPGIGNGRLPREAVLPLLTELPDNVHVWEYEYETVG